MGRYMCTVTTYILSSKFYMYRNTLLLYLMYFLAYNSKQSDRSPNGKRRPTSIDRDERDVNGAFPSVSIGVFLLQNSLKLFIDCSFAHMVYKIEISSDVYITFGFGIQRTRHKLASINYSIDPHTGHVSRRDSHRACHCPG